MLRVIIDNFFIGYKCSKHNKDPILEQEYYNSLLDKTEIWSAVLGNLKVYKHMHGNNGNTLLSTAMWIF